MSSTPCSPITSLRSADGTQPRLVLALTAGQQVAASAADPAARETGCCSFLTFNPRITDGTLTMTVSISDAHAKVLAAPADRAESFAGVAA